MYVPLGKVQKAEIHEKLQRRRLDHCGPASVAAALTGEQPGAAQQQQLGGTRLPGRSGMLQRR